MIADKDVVLIQPPFSPGNRPKFGLPPLGLLSIAGVLEENNISTKIIDAEINGLTVSQTVHRAMQFHPKLVAISVMTPDFIVARHICQELKSRDHRIKTVLGGPHIIATKAETLFIEESVDFLVIGEGEISCLELAKEVINNRRTYDGIDGLIFRGEQKKVLINEVRDVIENLDSLPFLNPNLIDNFKNQYDHPFATRKPIFSLMTSRGYPYPCSFCEVKTIFGKKLRQRSPQSIVDEILMLKNKFHLSYFSIKDSTFNLNHEWVTIFCEELLRRKTNIVWRCNVRADLIERRVFWLMKEAGCHNVFIGAESGSQMILDSIDKKLGLQDIRLGCKILHSLEIETCVQFILGNPQETSQTVQETIDFAKSLNSDYVRFSKATAYPGNGFYEWGVKTGRLRDPKWYLKNTIVHKESFLYDPNIGGTFKFPDFDLEKEVRRAHIDCIMTSSFIKKMFKKLFKHPIYLRFIFQVCPGFFKWVKNLPSNKTEPTPTQYKTNTPLNTDQNQETILTLNNS